MENLIKRYNNRVVLDIERLDIEEGKVYAVLGLNGSGKSTLLECIAGLIDYDEGKILYNGREGIENSRKAISMMVQKPYLFDKSVMDNIISGLKFRNENKKMTDKRLHEYLSFFSIDHLLYKNAKKLSGGEGAKTALLRTAVIETELTLLDEPTASMDMESTLQAERLIKSMAGGKRSVVIVTHDIFQAKRLADDVIFLDRGKIIEMGSAYKVFSCPKSSALRKIMNL